MSKRVAAIDCGTNSLRLLIADVDPARRELTDIERRMEIVRLGQGVDATGRLAPEALERTFRVLADYARLIRDAGATVVRMVATSATRDASNAAEFGQGVQDRLGIRPRSSRVSPRPGCRSPAPPPNWPHRGPDSIPSPRISSSISAAGRPSSC